VGYTRSLTGYTVKLTLPGLGTWEGSYGY